MMILGHIDYEGYNDDIGPYRLRDTMMILGHIDYEGYNGDIGPYRL